MNCLLSNIIKRNFFTCSHCHYSLRASVLSSVQQMKTQLFFSSIVDVTCSKSVACRKHSSAQSGSLFHNLAKKRQKRVKKLKGQDQKSYQPQSVLPSTYTVESSESTDENIDVQLRQLDENLSKINLQIAEQKEQLQHEDELMQQQFGVVLPSRYIDLVGQIDLDCPPSKYPCIGCGATIHCNDPSQPGFISSAKFKALDNVQKQNCKCLRCRGLDAHNVLLDAKVNVRQYEEIMSKIKHERSVVLHVVDMVDMENSFIPNLLKLVGRKHPIYIVGNKVDLIPKDDKGYLHRMKGQLEKYAIQMYGSNVKHVCLISAQTKYGVEQLVTKIMNHAYKYKAHIHLVGCTNSGKSTLFNALLSSDLCKIKGRELIGRATTSVWPGTTLNLLKFPLAKLPDWMLALRVQRLKSKQLEEHEERMVQQREYKYKNINNCTLRGYLDVTETEKQLKQNLHTDVDQYTYKKGSIQSVLSGNTPSEAFDYEQHNSQWLFDTPGLVSEKQIINLFGMEELRRLLMRRMPIPRTFSLMPGMSLFLAGLGRLDYIEGEGNILATVISAAGLPVNITQTRGANSFYQTALNDGSLMVPSIDSVVRMPALIGREFRTEKGCGFYRSFTDIQLSSLGWIAISGSVEKKVTLRAYTPGGKGCHVRSPLLPYAVTLRGARVSGSQAFRLRKPQ